MQKMVGIGVLARTRLSFAHCDVRDRFPMGDHFLFYPINRINL